MDLIGELGGLRFDRAGGVGEGGVAGELCIFLAIRLLAGKFHKNDCGLSKTPISK